MNGKPILNVVCAVIRKEGKILALRRKEGEKMAGLWEFPGGKIRENENPENTLVREIEEELTIIVNPDRALTPVDFEYPEFFIHLIPFDCTWLKGKITLSVHDQYQWLSDDDLESIGWCGADILIVRNLMQRDK